MDYTQSKGNLVELQCISKFIELGYECSIPYGNGAKYDFVVDVNGQFLRIQCKSASHPIDKSTGQYDINAIQFSCATQTTNTQKQFDIYMIKLKLIILQLFLITKFT